MGSASDSSGAGHAFSYRDGVFTDLGLGCGAGDINDSGVILGYCDTAVLFEGGSIVALNSLIDPNSGWSLDEVSAINNQYLLTPFSETPEPTTLWMAFGGILLVVAYRYGRNNRFDTRQNS